MPLILALHDIGEYGFDLNTVRSFGPGAYAETVKKFPFAVVTPQCRYNTLWDANALKKLIDVLLSTGRFSKNKVYVTGVGMGAFTAWYLPQKYPEFFAAAIPINGGGDEENICAIKRSSIWAFHGAKYDIIPIEQSRTLVTALKDCGRKNVELSIYSEHGHNLYIIVYNDLRIYKWLKKQ
jgi:predicted peptidase